MKEKQRILITTGIFPPEIGGPAQYAKNLRDTFEKMGHVVGVKTYGTEGKLPTGLRHLFFFIKVIPSLLSADAVFILDTFSVGLPTIFACKIFGKSGIIRTGGDFLWEQYVERTKKKVLLRNFYDTEKNNLSLKEKIIFKLTRWVLDNASKVVFSTEWQRDIFIRAYGLKREKTCIVENYYGEKEFDFEPESKIFIASTRKLVWKNLDVLEKVFGEIKNKHPEVVLFEDNLPYEEFLEKLKKSYATVLVSLGDISPNMILDSLRFNRPFICTKEVGIFERIKDAGIFVNPLDEREIEKAALDLLTEEGYRKAKEKIRNFDFTNTWEKMAEEFIKIYESCGVSKLKPSGFIFNIFKSFIAVRYFLCGISAAATNIILLYIFTDILHIWYLYSSVVAFLISIVISFILQKFVVFKDMRTNKMHHQFSKYFVAAILGIITNTAIMFACVDVLGIWYIFSQIVAGFFVMIQNFILYKFFIFNRR